MPEIKFLINEQSVNAMTWEEFEAFERAQEGAMKLKEIRPILARFMVNGGDAPLPHDEAMKVLGGLPVSKIKETVEIFTTALKDGTVPNGSRSSSGSPSEAGPAGSLSPDGQAL